MNVEDHTPTPETDAYCEKRDADGDFVHPEWRDFCQNLERERNEARGFAEEARNMMERDGYQVNPFPWEKQ